MFKATKRLLTATAIDVSSFRESLARVWSRRGKEIPRRFGLAVSGGVDSMALASLCSKIVRDGNSDVHLVAFVVDHKLRKGSTEEALNVVKNLSTLNVGSNVLTLDWGQHKSPAELPNLEALARKKRYQALGQACKEHHLNALLVAHHSDDQAETVLMRLANNYLGRGLLGIKDMAQIPECEGIFGVHQGDWPRSLVSQKATSHETEVSQLALASRGVQIVRPLLGFSKDRLIATCKQAGVRWFEDHTNQDRTLTLRNTVRYLQSDKLLPQALSSQSLCHLADRVAERTEDIEAAVQSIFVEARPTLDTRNGTATCHLQDSDLEALDAVQHAHHHRVALLRKMLTLVSPQRHILLTDLGDAADLLCPVGRGVERAESRVQIAGTLVCRRRQSPSSLTFSLKRATPNLQEKSSAQIKLSPLVPQIGHDASTSQPWVLWDKRYWMRVSSIVDAQRKEELIVRFLTVRDLALVRRQLHRTERNELDAKLVMAKGSLRFTLPAIFAIGGDNDTTGNEQLLALPTIGWSMPSIEESTTFEVRYKHVDDSLTEPV